MVKVTKTLPAMKKGISSSHYFFFYKSLTHILAGLMCGSFLALVALREPMVADPMVDLLVIGSAPSRLGGRRRGLRAVPSANMKQTLVVYAGPLHMTNKAAVGYETYTERYQMDKLHLANFDFFLQHGIDCTVHDTLLILGEPVKLAYATQLDNMNQACLALGHFIKLVTRDDACGDVEPMRLVLKGGVVDVAPYDALIHVSSEMSGPAPPSSSGSPSWTVDFTKHFTSDVHMVGLSHVCHGKHTHVQSSAFALDKKGIDLIRNSNVVFDCRNDNQGVATGEDRYDNLSAIVGRYEIGMSQTILEAGYKLHSILGDLTIDKVSRETCTGDDMWLTSRLKTIYGDIPSLKQVLFFKTSRYLPKDIQSLIGFNGLPEWEWK